MTESPPAKEFHAPERMKALSSRGVLMPAPQRVMVGREVPLENIAGGAVLHPFSRIRGERTRIGAGAVIGEAGPATLENAVIGAGAVVGRLGPVTIRDAVCGARTVLGCGVAEEAVFLGREEGGADFTTGYGFRVRKGSLYEEDANSAQHTDTKMTVLFPWVTLGSNINWCDVLVSGGKGAGLGEFSEVGSGTIHFNFTPRGDKATASSFGNAVDGVFLERPRLFLGGNGSMIGPIQADFGALSAAGGVFSGRLKAGLNPGMSRDGMEGERNPRMDFHLEIYGSVKRIYDSQLAFIAELVALEAWYAQVRAQVARGDPELELLYDAGKSMVRLNTIERIEQLGGLAGRMERSAELIEAITPSDPRIAQQRALVEAWPAIDTVLRNCVDNSTKLPDLLREALQNGLEQHGRVYTRVVRGLPPQAIASGRAWLAGIKEQVATPELRAMVPVLTSGG